MKITFALPLVLSTLSLFGVVGGASAQTFSIDRFVGGGSCTSTGGPFALSGTLGQPDANQQSLTGGTFSLAGGFWSFVVPTPGAPRLTIERQGADVRVFWPLPGTGFVLDQSLSVTGGWSQVTLPYTTNTTGISVGVGAPRGNTFYRLRKL